jgi:serine/threonine-protein kinase
VAEEQVFSPDIAAGNVAETDPAAGTVVSRDTVVSLKISKGPQPIAVPEFAGLAEQEAKDLATSTGFVPTDSERQFSTDVDEGTVITAYGVGTDNERVQLITGTEYYDQKPVTFLVSAGALPNVVGLPVNDAIALLQTKDVTGTPVAETVFDNTVPSGSVVSLQPATADAPVAPGDSVSLVVSKGPDLVDIPKVVGSTISAARKALTDAGFTVRVQTNVPTIGWGSDLFPVEEVRPGDAQAVRGSEITIIATFD